MDCIYGLIWFLILRKWPLVAFGFFQTSRDGTDISRTDLVKWGRGFKAPSPIAPAPCIPAPWRHVLGLRAWSAGLDVADSDT